MNESPDLSTSRLSHRVAMSFYGAIKEVPGLYGQSFAIQGKIDEEKKSFKCTIVLNKSLITAQEEEIHGDILQLVQNTILPVLPLGYTSTIGDISFSIQGKSHGLPESFIDGDISTSNSHKLREPLEHRCPYRHSTDVHPDNITGVQVKKDAQYTILKMHITLKNTLGKMGMDNMKQ